MSTNLPISRTENKGLLSRAAHKIANRWRGEKEKRRDSKARKKSNASEESKKNGKGKEKSKKNGPQSFAQTPMRKERPGNISGFDAERPKQTQPTLPSYQPALEATFRRPQFSPSKITPALIPVDQGIEAGRPKTRQNSHSYLIERYLNDHQDHVIVRPGSEHQTRYSDTPSHSTAQLIDDSPSPPPQTPQPPQPTFQIMVNTDLPSSSENPSTTFDLEYSEKELQDKHVDFSHASAIGTQVIPFALSEPSPQRSVHPIISSEEILGQKLVVEKSYRPVKGRRATPYVHAKNLRPASISFPNLSTSLSTMALREVKEGDVSSTDGSHSPTDDDFFAKYGWDRQRFLTYTQTRTSGEMERAHKDDRWDMNWWKTTVPSPKFNDGQSINCFALAMMEGDEDDHDTEDDATLVDIQDCAVSDGSYDPAAVHHASVDFFSLGRGHCP